MNTAVSFLLFLQTNFKGLSIFLLHSTTVPASHFSDFRLFYSAVSSDSPLR